MLSSYNEEIFHVLQHCSLLTKHRSLGKQQTLGFPGYVQDELIITYYLEM